MNKRRIVTGMLVIVFGAFLLAPEQRAEETSQKSDALPKTDADRPALKIVLVAPDQVTPSSVASWKKDGFGAVVVVLDDKQSREVYSKAATAVSEAALDLYFWIEVGRNPQMATEHPRWMASFGNHKDWLARYPRVKAPQAGEIAKVYPWVPIGYQKAFDAHLARIERLLKRVPSDFHGLLLNDLQGGPAACGCPNPQCRWALDYNVASTAAKVDGDDVAAKFLAQVRKLVPDKVLVPIWATECEEIDLPANRRPTKMGTGLCASVSCALGDCPRKFTSQWTALCKGHSGPIGVLLLHKELNRKQPAYGHPVAWVADAIAYLDRVPPRNGGKSIPHDRFWAVIQDYDTTPEETAAAWQSVVKREVGAVVFARTRIDQSFEPRIIPTK